MFKDIEWYEWNYQVSDIWEVNSIDYHRSWNKNILKPGKDRFWYLMVSLSKNWKWHTKKIHRLVAQSFIPNPDNKPQVNHINWIKSDNRAENLEWNTASENIKHAYDTKLRIVTENHNFITNPPWKWKFWKYHYNSKKVLQYSKNWIFIREWGSIIDVERELWIQKQNISKCCKWKQKSAGGFIWKYFIAI